MMRRKRGAALLLCALLSLSAVSAAGLAEYRLEDLGLSVSLPEDWVLFTPETADDDPGLGLLGVDGKTLRQSLEETDTRLNAVLPDMSAEIAVICLEDTRSRNTFDYNLVTPEDLDIQGNSVVEHDFSKSTEGMKYLSFEQIQGEQARFLRFVGEIRREDGYTQFIQYSTVLNGTAVNVTLHSFGREATDGEQELLQSVVDSLRWDEVLERTVSRDTIVNFVVLGILLLALIGSFVFFTVRYRRNKKKN